MRILLLCFFVSFSCYAQELPIKAFGALPAASQVKLSPDGQMLAYKGNLNGQSFIASVDLSSGEKKYLVTTDNQKFKIGWHRWANNKTILVSSHFAMQGLQVKYGESRLLKVPADGSKAPEPVVRSGVHDVSAQFQSNIVDMLPDDPEHILMALYLNRKERYGVYKVSLGKKRKRELVQYGRAHIHHWMTDQQHRVRLGFGSDDTTGFYRLLDLQTNQWRRIWEYEIFDEPGVSPLGFGLDPNILYVRAQHNDRAAIFKVDVSKPDLPRELVYSDANYDIDGRLIYSDKTRDVIGIFHSEAEGSKIFFDKKYKSFQASLDKAIPDAFNLISSFSQDERRYIVFTSNTKEPGAYYLGDRDTKSLTFVLEQYPLLYQQPLSGKEKITYQARDELSIEGYLTPPRGGDIENSPALIIPHGGPIARDHDGFDWLTEFFASRGYTVLQPNFRGSSGYGFEFAMESIGGWGGAMQDDLADAAFWLIKDRNVSPERICILGGSYGGYAALMAAATQQAPFKCAASFAGVSDLQMILNDARRFSNYKIVKKQLAGDKGGIDPAKSPINYVKNIAMPVMLIHGDKDIVVDVEHSRAMFNAMKKHNKQVEYIELENGDHNMSIEENRLKVLSSLQDFLSRHLPVTID